MKKYKITMIIILLLSLITCGVSLMFLGDIVPSHIGVNGKPDQWASKYFILLFPGVMSLITIIMLLLCKVAKLTENYKKYMLLTGTILNVMFYVLTVIFIVYGITYTEETPAFDISKIMMILFGILFIVLGNFMPKIEKNRTLGLKTYWSMYNEVTWQKTHRFTGYVSVIVGVLTLVAGLFFKELVNFIILMVLVFGLVISCSIASYVYYKQEKKKESENQ